nr:MAG TPA: hypothetical protein [Bacteriophage sp.]
MLRFWLIHFITRGFYKQINHLYYTNSCILCKPLKYIYIRSFSLFLFT